MAGSVAADTPARLKERILRAGAWTMGGYALAQLIRLGSNLAMTRLLMPEMFGLMAIAHMLMIGLALLSDMGLRQNIVQSRRGDDPLFLDTAWTLQILRGGAIWLVALAVALGLFLARRAGLSDPGTAYGHPLLPPVIAGVAVSALIWGCQSTKVATAHRHLQQMRLVGMELVGQLASVVLMIAWARLAPGIWALVAGNLAAALVTTTLSHVWLAGPRNRWRREAAALRDLLAFGRWVLLASGIGVLAASADRLLLGALVDTRLLGVYAIGQLMVATVESGVGKLFLNVSLPALSEAVRGDPGNLQALYYRILTPLDLALFFATGLLFAGGPALVALLYDARYGEAGPILSVLSLSLPGARFGMAHQLYLALGQPRLMTGINAVRLLALLLLIPAAFHLAGFAGAVWAVALHNFLTVPLVYYFNRQIGITDPRREIRGLPALPLGLAAGWLIAGAAP